MKKLIIALAVFALMMGGAVAEIIYTTRNYEHLALSAARLLSDIRVCAEYKKAEDKADKRSEDSTTEERLLSAAEEKARAALKELESGWGRSRNVALMLGNHTVVKSVDEKITSMRAQSEVGLWEDAGVTCAVLKEYFDDLKDDNHITLSNLF